MFNVELKILEDSLDGNLCYSTNNISMFIVNKFSIIRDQRPGVYILLGDYNYKQQIYIGQTSNIYNRLYQHSRAKDFWNKAIYFVNNNGGFTPTDIKWLEEKLIKIFTNLKFNIISNYQIPKSFNISEQEMTRMNDYFKIIKLLLELISLSRNHLYIDSDTFRNIDANDNIYKENSKNIITRIAKEYNSIKDPINDEDGIVEINTDDISVRYFDIGDGRIMIGKGGKISNKNIKKRLRLLNKYKEYIDNYILSEDIILDNENLVKLFIGL